MDINIILKNLKKEGFRITKARRSILASLIKSKEPISPLELHRILKSHGLSPDRATVYRELDFLEKKNIIKEIHLETEKEKRYEINNNIHHHHAICKKCEKIEDIELGTDLEEKILRKVKNFADLEHSLEFYGLCVNCR